MDVTKERLLPPARSFVMQIYCSFFCLCRITGGYDINVGGLVGPTTTIPWINTCSLKRSSKRKYRSLNAAILRPVYTCDFAHKTRLTLPCTNVYFAKHLVDWKERYHILFEDTLLSNFCQLGGILSRRYATINPCGVGWGRFCACVTCLQIRAKNLRCESALQVGVAS